MKKDIQTKEDIGYLVDVFYDRVLKDEKIAHFFAHLNFEKHKPKMVQFWSIRRARLYHECLRQACELTREFRRLQRMGIPLSRHCE